MKFIFLLLLSILISCSSTKESPSGYSFYHWKSKAKMTPGLESQLTGDLNKVFLHYFDVVPGSNEGNPAYILTEVDDWYKDKEIVPVVFITNKLLGRTYRLEQLAKGVSSMVNEMSLHHFGRKIKTLQIDCDWSVSTQKNYFQFLKLLKANFDIEVTIRLHQIKYPEKTGIPPVDRGVLMVYNIGDLKNMQENSILNTKVLKSYINEDSEYPIPLDIALPLFSQLVIKNSDGNVKLINRIPESISDTSTFQKIENNLYQPIIDTLYHGFYLNSNFQIKTEQVKEEILVETIKILKDSDLDMKSIIYYHLDEPCLENYNLTKISTAL